MIFSRHSESISEVEEVKDNIIKDAQVLMKIRVWDMRVHQESQASNGDLSWVIVTMRLFL